MRKNLRVVQINGFRGLFLTLFIISCLIAGFIAFPAFLAMCSWNYISSRLSSVPVINFGGGLLLWGIIAMSVYVFNNRKFIVSFKAQQELTDAEMKEIITKIKSKTINPRVGLHNDIDVKAEQDENISEISSNIEDN